MFLKHVPAIMALEQQVHAFPWSTGIMCDCIRSRHINQIIELEGEIIGYSIVSIGAGESHLLNISVAKDKQRQGIGAKLLLQMISLVRKEQVKVMFLEVRQSNLIACSLYKKLGFIEIGRRKRYYRAATGREDALVLSLSIF
jgi:[ribosomal protein S18]-alanine N-acetyltransferase